MVAGEKERRGRACSERAGRSPARVKARLGLTSGHGNRARPSRRKRCSLIAWRGGEEVLRRPRIAHRPRRVEAEADEGGLRENGAVAGRRLPATRDRRVAPPGRGWRPDPPGRCRAARGGRSSPQRSGEVAAGRIARGEAGSSSAGIRWSGLDRVDRIAGADGCKPLGSRSKRE